MVDNSSEKVLSLIDGASNIVLTTHVAPDGDAIGSVLALREYLINIGKNAIVINHSPTPFNLSFLNKANEIRVFSQDIQENTRLIENADIIFILDTNEFHRTKSMESTIKNSPAAKVCIDHHTGINHDLYDAVISRTDNAATCQILYDFFQQIDPECISSNIAEYLYVGIMTDTGSFRHTRTDSRVFAICSDLVARGADPVMLYDEIFNRVTKEMMQLQASFLSGLEFYFSGKLVFGKVMRADLNKYGLNIDHVEGFSGMLMSIEGVKVGVLLVELRDNLKLSFRTKGNIPANEMARSLGGGGHFNAGGANVFNANEEDLKREVLKLVEPYVQ